MCLFGEKGRNRGRQPARTSPCYFSNKSFWCWKGVSGFWDALVTAQHGLSSCCRSFMPSAPAWRWGHFLTPPSHDVCTHFPASIFSSMRWHFSTGSWFYLLLTNGPSKSSFKKMWWKSEGFSQMAAGFCGRTKESARFLLFECPCLSSQLVNPFPFSKLILPAGDCTQKLLLGLLGEWEGWDTAELSNCLIATNFNPGCPKYTLQDTYQRQKRLKGIALYLSW